MKKIKIYESNFGIPLSGIMKLDSRWIPVFNPRIRTKKYRHHTQVCPECGARKKNIRLHYKTYHKEWYMDTFIKPFYKNQIGEIYGVRFMSTKKA